MLNETDPEIYNLIKLEEERQNKGIELIASENFTSMAVRECLGSCLTNKYSEGRPNNRYYGGNKIIDRIELLCQQRALCAFNLDKKNWSVNVQPYSGSPANFAVYTGILKPGDRIMGLDLPSGGHLSHGFQTDKKKISATSIFFNTDSYKVDDNGWINYDDVEKEVLRFSPHILICGASCYPRDFDYKRFRQIADSVGAYLMADIAHISGFVAVGEMNNPFEYCDIVTTTTHKTLRGPRSGMIFINKMKNPGLLKKIDDAIFPGLQGGPHNHQIAAVAVQLKEVQTIKFKEYIKEVKFNAKLLAGHLKSKGFILSTDGTDNHLILINLTNFGITGSKMEKICELVNISLNKNTIKGDKSAISPSGIRIGTAYMTTKHFTRWNELADWLYRCVLICQRFKNRYGLKLKDWINLEFDKDIIALSKDINIF